MNLACIGDPAFIYVQLCSHPVCIGGPAFIRGWRLIEEIQYMYKCVGGARSLFALENFDSTTSTTYRLSS